VAHDFTDSGPQQREEGRSLRRHRPSVLGRDGLLHRLLRYVNPFEIAVNRSIWSIPIGLAIAWHFGLLGGIWRILTNPR